MARRIAGVVLALVALLLVALAVPLGLLTSAQDTRQFRFDAVSAATTLANVAEERLGDHVHDLTLRRSVSQLARQGDRVAVYDAAGRLVAGTGGRLAVRRLTAGAPAPGVRSYSSGDRFVVLAPVVPDSGVGAIGTVTLSRSAGSLDDRVMTLWTMIAAVSAAGLAAAAVIAYGLARWASRPLAALADAAGRLGGGALDTRAQVRAGPPEVRDLSGIFNTMAARLESLVHGHQAMMADVSHQLRTPLAALRLRLDLLAQDADEATAAEVAGAQDEIARLVRLVNGLLAVARAENVTTAPVRVSVDQVVADRAAAWNPAAEERGVSLRAIAGGPVTARAGEGQLEQILDNLIANALDVLEVGGTIGVTAAAVTSAGRAVARITVADDGPGMTPQQQRAAFRRFATGTSRGSGLGLAIVDRLTTAGGGSAALSDTPGGGLTVTIELPIASTHRVPGKPGDPAAGDLNQF